MLRRLIAVAFFGLAASLILLSIPPSQPAMANNERGRKRHKYYDNAACAHLFDCSAYVTIKHAVPCYCSVIIDGENSKFQGLLLAKATFNPTYSKRVEASPQSLYIQGPLRNCRDAGW